MRVHPMMSLEQLYARADSRQRREIISEGTFALGDSIYRQLFGEDFRP